MNHERALTIAGGFVAVVMAGLLSINAINSLLTARGAELEQLETCEVADSTATPALILKVAKNQL